MTDKKPAPIMVRRATAEDAATLAGLIKAAFAEYQAWLVPPSGALNETAGTIAAEFASNYGAAIVELRRKAVGCVLFRPDRDNLYLGRLSVLPKHRGKGIAAALVSFVEDEARGLGCPGVVLGVRIALPANQEFFARLGYEEIARHAHDGFDEPTWIEMRKGL